jgi:hypothetical protein
MAFFRVAGERMAFRKPSVEQKPLQQFSTLPVTPKKTNGSALEHNFTRF